MQLRVKPKTWQVYELTHYQGLPPNEIAAKLGMSMPAFYKAKGQVIKLLKRRIAKLDRIDPGKDEEAP